MFFSFIVPVYNTEKYLVQCLNSILSQSFKDFEVLLIDDGSTDSSPKICDEYSKEDQRIKVIHKKNEGVSIARQVGIENSTGEYVTFVDSDDWVSTELLSSFHRIIKNYSPDVVCCDYIDSNNVKHISNIRKGFYNKNQIITELYPILIHGVNNQSFPPMLWSKAFKRNLYKKNEVKNVKIVMGEDGACVRPCIYNSNSIYYSDNFLYFYRINDNSVTQRISPLPWDGPYLVSSHLKNHINYYEYDMEAQIFRYTIHALFNVAISQFGKKLSYTKISREIRNNISKRAYREAAEKCNFTNSISCKIAKISIKYKLVGVMYLAYIYKKHIRNAI